MTRRRSATAALAAILLLLPAAPAAADPLTWRFVPCATGAITGAQGTRTDGYWPGRSVSRVSVTGWIQPCRYDDPSPHHGFMLYHPTVRRIYHDPGVPDSEIWPYLSPTAPTPFAISAVLPYGSNLAYPDLPPIGPVAALCVVRVYDSPVACVAIDQTADGPPAVSPIPPDDPRVASVRIEHSEHLQLSENHCGSCL